MAISARCPACGKDYQLADEQAGQRVRCRKCRAEFDVAGRVEMLEAVPMDALSTSRGGGPRSALHESIGTPAPPRRRKWRYVLGGVAAALLLLFLACTGTVWMAVEQGKKGVAQLQKQLAARELEAKQADERAKKEKDKADREKEKADRERENADKAREEADRKLAESNRRIVTLEQQMKGVQRDVVGMDELRKALAGMKPDEIVKLLGGLGLKGAELEKLLAGMKDLMDLATTKVGPVRDVDDCVARLRSKSRPARVSALRWIGEKQSFPNPQEKKKIIDALAPLAEGEDPLLQKDAVFWKLALELDP